MGFPPLETIVKYGIYTAHQLQKFNQGLVPPKQVTILQECETCEFVHPSGHACDNCLGLIRNPNADSNELCVR
jgi:hypothetical protein